MPGSAVLTPLDAEILRRELSWPTDEDILLDVLREYNVKVYRPADVQAYQTRLVNRVMKPLWAAVMVTRVLFIASMALFVVSCILAVVVSGMWVWGILPFPFAMLACVEAASRWRRTDARWIRFRFGGYQGRIPAVVGQLQTRLKTQVPGMKFTVEEFQVRRRPRDPLLFAHLGQARFCIAVWDERDFKAQPQ